MSEPTTPEMPMGFEPVAVSATEALNWALITFSEFALSVRGVPSDLCREIVAHLLDPEALTTPNVDPAFIEYLRATARYLTSHSNYRPALLH